MRPGTASLPRGHLIRAVEATFVGQSEPAGTFFPRRKSKYSGTRGLVEYIFCLFFGFLKKIWDKNYLTYFFFFSDSKRLGFVLSPSWKNKARCFWAVRVHVANLRTLGKHFSFSFLKELL